MIKYLLWIFSFCVFVAFACEKPTEQLNSGLDGKLYRNIGPGFVRLNAVATIVALNADSTQVSEVQSDSTGTFRISLSPGTYFLYVKESRDKLQSGPYEVPSGSYIEAKAYVYDSRIL